MRNSERSGLEQRSEWSLPPLPLTAHLLTVHFRNTKLLSFGEAEEVSEEAVKATKKNMSRQDRQSNYFVTQRNTKIDSGGSERPSCTASEDIC
jgi:hypothetical protein